MTDTQQEQLRVRVARALQEVDKAKEQLRRGEFLTAAQLARRAAENLLTLVALTGQHLRPEDRRDDLHLDRLTQILRRGDALPRRTADHVEVVKRVGNRAAHPQESLSDEVSAHDAEASLHSLDEVVRWFRERVPAELLVAPTAPAPTPLPKATLRARPAPPARRPWLATGGLFVAALAAPLVGFGVMLSLQKLVNPSVVPVVTTTTPLPAALDADPVADAPPPVPALNAEAAAERAELVRMRVSADLDLTADLLAGLGCSDLARSRNWLWVRHGYVHKDPTERAAFDERGPTARPSATSREIRRDFTSHDQVNQSLLEQALRAGECPCPQAARPDRPCPE